MNRRELLVGLAASAFASLARAQERPVLETGTYEGVPWPIVEAPVWPPPRCPLFPPAVPATPAAERVQALLAGLPARAQVNRYQHTTVIRARDGVFLWDCSAMSAWVLRQAAPGALRAISRPRPVARDFVRAIEEAPVEGSRLGWRRVPRLLDARPGDVFAWRRPRGFPSRNTGHVGFFVEAPVQVPGAPMVAARIADSTSFGHQYDTRSGDEDGGFGVGTLAFLLDRDGAGTAYGWYGTLSDGYVVTPILVGRLTTR